MAPQLIEVNLLGPFEVRVGGSLIDVPGVRTRAVLARLALDAGSVVAVDQLIDLMREDGRWVEKELVEEPVGV